MATSHAMLTLSVEVLSVCKTAESYNYELSISKAADGSEAMKCEVPCGVIENFHNKMLDTSKKFKQLLMPNFPHKDTFEDDYETCALATNVYFSQLIAAIKMSKKKEAISILTSFLDEITSQSKQDGGKGSNISPARAAQLDFSAQLQAQTSLIERVEANQKQTNDALLAFSTVIQDFGMRIGQLEGQRGSPGYGNNSANSSRRSSMNPNMDESSLYSGTDYGDMEMLSPEMIQNFSVSNTRPYSGRSVASDITASTAGFSAYSHEVDRDNFDSMGASGHPFPSVINGNMPPHLFNGGILHMGQDGKPALRRTSSGATTNSNDTRALGIDDDTVEGVDNTTNETTTTANNTGISMSMSPRSTLVRQLSGKHGSSAKASRNTSMNSAYNSPSVEGGRDSLRRGSTESYKSYENWQSRRSARMSAGNFSMDDATNSVISGSTGHNSLNTSIDNSGINDFEGLDWEIYGNDPSNITHSYRNSAFLPANVIPHNMNKSTYDEIIEQILSLIKPQYQQVSFRSRIYLFLRKHTRKVLRCRLYQVGMHALRCTLPDDPLCATVIVKGGDNSKWCAILGNSLNKTAEKNVSSNNSVGNGSHTNNNNFNSGATVSSFGSGGLMASPDSKQNSDDENSKSSNRTLVSGSKIKNVSLLGPDADGENGNNIMDAASMNSGNNGTVNGGNESDGNGMSNYSDQFNIQFLYDALPVKISANKLNEMCLITFVEQLSVLVGQDHLFKDTLLLVRAWWIYETAAYLGTSIKHYLNDWSICIMLSAIFNKYHEEIHHPLQALAIFLAEYGSIDWYHSAITLQGVVPMRPTDPSQPDGEVVPWLSNPHPSHLIQSNLIKKYWFVYNVNPQVLEQMSQDAAAANATTPGGEEEGDESSTTGKTPYITPTTAAANDNKGKPPQPPPPPRGNKDNGVSPTTSRTRLDSDTTTVTTVPIPNGTPADKTSNSTDNSHSKNSDVNGVSPDGTRASLYSNTVNVHAFDDTFICDFDALPEHMKPQQKVKSFVRSYANIVNPLDNSNLFSCTDTRKGRRRLKYIAKAFENGAKKLAYALRLDLHHHNQSKSNSYGSNGGAMQGGVSAISHFFGATTMRYCSGVRPDSFYGNLLYPLPHSLVQDEESQIDSDDDGDTLEGRTATSKGAVYLSASLQTLWKDLLYCNMILSGQVSATALSSMIDDILINRGALPIGEVGKQLQDSNCVHNIGAKLKERFSGLKRFLQHYPDKYLICTDHPYNPHTFLFNRLSTEDKKVIANGEITTEFISKFKKSRPKKRHSTGSSASSVSSAYGNQSTSHSGAPPGFPPPVNSGQYWHPNHGGQDTPYNVAAQQYPPPYRHSISAGGRPTGMIPGPPGDQYINPHPNQFQLPGRSGSMNMGGYPPQYETSKRHSIGALPPPPNQRYQAQGAGHLGIAAPSPILIPTSNNGMGQITDKALASPGGGKSQILQAIQKARQHQVTHGVPINATDLGSIGLEDNFGSNPNLMAAGHGNDGSNDGRNSKSSGSNTNNSGTNSNANIRNSNISNANSDMNAFWSDSQELKLTEKR